MHVDLQALVIALAVILVVAQGALLLWHLIKPEHVADDGTYEDGTNWRDYSGR